jgi:large subunit ribosomal protein L25
MDARSRVSPARFGGKRMERKLKAASREGIGKGAARKLRPRGMVPAVVYGQGAQHLHVTVDSRELFHLLHTDAGMNVLIDMRVDHDHFLAMPREVQRDHIKGEFIHADFFRIAKDEKVTVEVPIHLSGESPGVKQGGVVEHHLWSLQVECFPQDVPGAIEADISSLGMMDSLKVSDLKLRGKFTVLTPADETIVSVVQPQVLKVAEEVEEALEGVGEEAAEAATETAGEAEAEAPAEAKS